MNWKNLKTNPPSENCDVCLAFVSEGKFIEYTTFFYDAGNGKLWHNGLGYNPKDYKWDVYYINLQEVKL